MMTELYRHWGEDGTLLYVGISQSTVVRLAQHAKDSHWSRKISSITVQRFPTREEALAAEREAIKIERPRHNKQHSEVLPLSHKRAYIKRAGFHVISSQSKSSQMQFDEELSRLARIASTGLETTEDDCPHCHGNEEGCERCIDGFVPVADYKPSQLAAHFADYDMAEFFREGMRYPDAWRVRVEGPGGGHFNRLTIVLECVIFQDAEEFLGTKLAEYWEGAWWFMDATSSYHLRIILAQSDGSLFEVDGLELNYDRVSPNKDRLSDQLAARKAA